MRNIIITVFACGFLLTYSVPAARAHNLEQMDRRFSVNLDEEKLIVHLLVDYGDILAFSILKKADLNNNGRIESQEAVNCLGILRRKIENEVTILLNDKKLQTEPGEIHSSDFEGDVGVRPFSLEYRASFQGPFTREMDLNIEDISRNDLVGKRFFKLETKGYIIISSSMLGHPPKPEGFSMACKKGTDPEERHLREWPPEKERAPAKDDGLIGNRFLIDSLTAKQPSPAAITMAVLIAAVLGFFHGLSPGHGKALVSSYLIQSEGRFRDALILALTVTVTHTGSVFLMGIIALFLSKYIMPESIYPWINLVSGLFIAVIGSRMVIQTCRHVYVHNHGDHHHNHHRLSIWQTLLLGISGGMVPCPSALVVLLAAVNVKRIILGLILILSFSVGLAILLLFLGTFMVITRKHFVRDHGFSRYLPVISGTFILALGIIFCLNGLQGVAAIRKVAEIVF